MHVLTLKSSRLGSTRIICSYNSYMSRSFGIIVPVLVIRVLGSHVGRSLRVESKTGARSIEGQGNFFQSVAFGLYHVCNVS